MDLGELRNRLRDPGSISWVPVGELRGRRVVSCIDGRHRSCTIGSPGGNAGELVRMLAVLEWYAGLRFEPATVRAVLRSHLERLGSFYLHTDRHAAQRLAASVGAPVVEPEALLRRPSAELLPALRRTLVEPAHVGCGHLRLLVERSHDYRVRRELVEHVIVTFFELLWDGAEGLELAVLDGEHQEAALLVFHTPDPVVEATPVPTWCAANEGPSVFVTHVPALRWHRRDLLELIRATMAVERLLRLDPVDVLLEVERLSERHLDLTMRALAPDLPRHRVQFRTEPRELAA